MSKLNHRQRAFADEYIITGNATQSAIKAGYSERTARSQGQRLLTNVDIKKYMDLKIKEIKIELYKINKENVNISYKLIDILRDYFKNEWEKVKIGE